MSTRALSFPVTEWLDARERQLQALIGVGGAPDTAPHEVTDLKDGAAEEAQAGIDDAELTRHLAELGQIAAARQRLAEGRYGDCVDCGDAIAEARLRAQPTAVRCTECQAATEAPRH